MIDIYTLDGDDAIAQLIAVIHFGLPTAMAAEVISPENETNLKAWCRAEAFRLRPERSAPKAPYDPIRGSKYSQFWETLEPDQEVRWTKTKHATYFVVDGQLHRSPPQGSPSFMHTAGPWIELRRHTGKIFWSHIVFVRPLDEL